MNGESDIKYEEMFEVVDDTAPMSDSHIDDTETDNSDFINGKLF